MEEAQALSDVVAIMCHSRLWALGTVISLRTNFGSGYQVLVELTDDTNVDGLKDLSKNFDQVVVDSVSANTVVFKAPRDALDVLPEFLSDLEGSKSTLGFVNYDVTISSLKDVFISFRDKSDGQFLVDNPSLTAKLQKS
ncbi:hypothetical protein GEMRC1_002352 [Eukaryota sp. GEM-RC1]